MKWDGHIGMFTKCPHARYMCYRLFCTTRTCSTVYHANGASLFESCVYCIACKSYNIGSIRIAASIQSSTPSRKVLTPEHFNGIGFYYFSNFLSNATAKTYRSFFSMTKLWVNSYFLKQSLLNCSYACVISSLKLPFLWKRTLKRPGASYVPIFRD